MPEIKTFAPDLNPLSAGILTDCDNLYPSPAGGMRALPPFTGVADALAAECVGLGCIQDLSVNYRVLAGTATKIYELSGTSWTDVSKAGDYASPGRWRFCPWGNYVLASNWFNPLQVQADKGDLFADVAGSPPKAKYLTTCQNFVILAHITDDGTATARTNRVHWSGQGDHTLWTPSLTTQAGYVDLNDTPGAITGVAKLGNNYVVFKDRAIYLVTYIGPPLVWSFQRIGGYSGCPSNEAIVESEAGIFYPGLDDFYVFDGNMPQRIGGHIKDWFFNRLHRMYSKRIMGTYDPINKLIFWMFPTTANGTDDPVDFVILDPITGRWGRKQQAAEAIATYISPNVTYGTISTYFATYAAITASGITYWSPWWIAVNYNLAIVNSSHVLALISGTPTTSTLVTGDMGDARSYKRLTRVMPYFNTYPTACVVTPKTKNYLGQTAVSGTPATVDSQNKADVNVTGKFISLSMSLTGDFEIVGFDTETKPVSGN